SRSGPSNSAAMTTIRFYCTSCQQYLQIPADRAGRKVRCGRCQAVVTVPAASEELEMATPVVEGAPPVVLAEVHEQPYRRALRDEREDDDSYDRANVRLGWGPLRAGMVSHIVAGWLMIASAALAALGLVLLTVAMLIADSGSEGLAKAALLITI